MSVLYNRQEVKLKKTFSMKDFVLYLMVSRVTGQEDFKRQNKKLVMDDVLFVNKF